MTQLAAPSRFTRPIGRRIFGSAPWWSIAVVAGTGLLVLAPVASLVAIAAGGGHVPRSLLADVLPVALLETTLLLGGIAIVAGTIGIGTAWLVTAHDFPLRATLAWLLPLPL